MKKRIVIFLIPGLLLALSCSRESTQKNWVINEYDYLETPGLSILSFHNFYPVGKQGGIELIHHGERIATNGFIRIASGTGQRLPQPENAERQIDRENNEIRSTVFYPDLDFKYSIEIKAEGNDIRLSVNLEKPIPEEWEN